MLNCMVNSLIPSVSVDDGSDQVAHQFLNARMEQFFVEQQRVSHRTYRIDMLGYDSRSLHGGERAENPIFINNDLGSMALIEKPTQEASGVLMGLEVNLRDLYVFSPV